MPELREHFIFRIDGDAFDEYYPAERVSRLSLSVEKLLSISAQAAISERTGFRPRLQILASFPKRGSYVQEFVLVWDVADNLMKSVGPALVPLLPELIPMITKGIEIAKDLLKVFASDDPPSITVTDNKGTVLINNQIHVHFDSFVNNGTIAEPLIDIARQLGNGFDRVTVEGTEGKQISLDEVDRESLANPRTRTAAKRLSRSAEDLKIQKKQSFLHTEEVEEIIEATVDILSFDKTRRTGSLTVVNSENLPRGKYSFELARRPETQEAIKAMMQPRVRVLCRTTSSRKLEILQVDVALGE